MVIRGTKINMIYNSYERNKIAKKETYSKVWSGYFSSLVVSYKIYNICGVSLIICFYYFYFKNATP